MRQLRVCKSCRVIFRKWTSKLRGEMTRWNGWRLRLTVNAIQGCIPASCRQSLSLWTWSTRFSPVSLGEKCPKTWKVCIVFRRASQLTRLIQTKSSLFELIKMFEGISTSSAASLTSNGQYTFELKIGTPPKPFSFYLDTQSDYLVVSSELCIKCPSRAYKPGLSLTTHNLGTMWDLGFDSEKFSFRVQEFQDTICFNDACLTQQPFYTVLG